MGCAPLEKVICCSYTFIQTLAKGIEVPHGKTTEYNFPHDGSAAF